MQRRTLPVLLLGSVIGGLTGAVLMYFLDPKQGNRRRKMTAQQVVASFHHTRDQLVRRGRATNAQLYGYWQQLTHLKPAEKPTPNDETVTQRVRSQVLRNPALHHHRININTQHGVVFLRGEVDTPEQMRHLEKEIRHIPGVRGVQNLLHLPHTPAPTSR